MNQLATPAIATLAGGCFWCTEAAFEQLRGVLTVQPGYMGGEDPAPSYEKVCGGRTGHAEVVQITYDPAEIDFATLLTVFFTIHDPTTLNRQGHDVGTQYRSAIFFHDEAQKAVAESLIGQLNAEGAWPSPIVTEVTPATTFFVAEPYHHQYFRNNPHQGYCMAVVAPKALKTRQKFSQLLKPSLPMG
jgi:peptide-methionine (S)-S-oxide reductase